MLFRSAEHVGFVFQQFHLIPYLSAAENVMLAQYFHSMSDEQEARQMLARVGLGERATHLPGQLSGGEQQRVAIARALINQPSILLADEPTGNLDSKNGEIIMGMIAEFNQSLGMTVVLVTHERALAERYARRMIYMADGNIVKSEPNPAALSSSTAAPSVVQSFPGGGQ